MQKRLISYKFSINSGNKDIADFLSFIDQILLTNPDANISEGNEALPLKVKEDFNAMIAAFERFMSYAQINEKWQIQDKYIDDVSMITLIQKTKKVIQRMLIKGILQLNYTNIIFCFHQHKPLINSMQVIYKLLINSIIDVGAEANVDLERVVTLYLMNAATYNNCDAIQILITEYSASPINTWPALNVVTNKLEAIIMPIIQLTNTKKASLDKQVVDISCIEQEYNFIFMLNNIDFSSTSIETWKLQEIFMCAFKNKFIDALNNLLLQQDFCQRLILTEEDLIMIAFSVVVFPTYNSLVNMIIKKNNLLKTFDCNSEDTLKKIEYYKVVFEDMIKPVLDCENFDYTIIKAVITFLSYFIDVRPESEMIPNWLIVVQATQEKLKAENEMLLQNNLKLQAEILLLKSQLDAANISYLSEKHVKTTYFGLANQKIRTLEKQLSDSRINMQVIEYKYTFLINENYRLQETLNTLLARTPSPSTSSKDVEEHQELLLESSSSLEPQLLESPTNQSQNNYCILESTRLKLNKLTAEIQDTVETEDTDPMPVIKRRHSYFL
jgi:hypothetical protein